MNINGPVCHLALGRRCANNHMLDDTTARSTAKCVVVSVRVPSLFKHFHFEWGVIRLLVCAG